jgi:hypothetical protein
VNPSKWIQTVLSEAFPKRVFKDVVVSMPNWWVQHHITWNSVTGVDWENTMDDVRINVQLRVVAPNSDKAYSVSRQAIKTLRAAADASRVVDNVKIKAFDVIQLPVENFKLTAVKGVMDAQVDSMVTMSFYESWGED